MISPTIILRQYLRSALSIGANVQEAQAAESRKDFVHKLAIARKEARESMYWLLLDDGHLIGSERLSGLIEENRALMLILSKIIIVTLRNSNKLDPDGAKQRSGNG